MVTKIHYVKTKKELFSTKAQASLVFNVVIGLLFIFFAMFIFIFINATIEKMKEDSIIDTQQLSLASSYVSIIPHLNEQRLEDFMNLRFSFSRIEHSFSNQQIFSTLHGEMLAASGRHERGTFCRVNDYSGSRNKDYVAYLHKNTISLFDISLFDLCVLFIGVHAEEGDNSKEVLLI